MYDMIEEVRPLVFVGSRGLDIIDRLSCSVAYCSRTTTAREGDEPLR